MCWNEQKEPYRFDDVSNDTILWFFKLQITIPYPIAIETKHQHHLCFAIGPDKLQVIIHLGNSYLTNVVKCKKSVPGIQWHRADMFNIILNSNLNGTVSGSPGLVCLVSFFCSSNVLDIGVHIW